MFFKDFEADELTFAGEKDAFNDDAQPPSARKANPFFDLETEEEAATAAQADIAEVPTPAPIPEYAPESVAPQTKQEHVSEFANETIAPIVLVASEHDPDADAEGKREFADAYMEYAELGQTIVRNKERARELRIKMGRILRKLQAGHAAPKTGDFLSTVLPTVLAELKIDIAVPTVYRWMNQADAADGLAPKPKRPDKPLSSPVQATVSEGDSYHDDKDKDQDASVEFNVPDEPEVTEPVVSANTESYESPSAVTHDTELASPACKSSQNAPKTLREMKVTFGDYISALDTASKAEAIREILHYLNQLADADCGIAA